MLSATMYDRGQRRQRSAWLVGSVCFVRKQLREDCKCKARCCVQPAACLCLLTTTKVGCLGNSRLSRKGCELTCHLRLQPETQKKTRGCPALHCAPPDNTRTTHNHLQTQSAHKQFANIRCHPHMIGGARDTSSSVQDRSASGYPRLSECMFASSVYLPGFGV